MNPMKYGIILPLLIVFLVGIGSGGFVNQPTEIPSGAPLGVFDDYEPVWLYPVPEGLPGSVNQSTSSMDMDYYYYKPVWLYPLPEGLPEWLYPKTDPEDTGNATSPEGPAPFIMPEPLPISKEELFGSLTVQSGNKKSVISSQINSIFF
jgi:hypothetical protein